MSQITLDKLPEQILDAIAAYLAPSSSHALCFVSRALLWPAKRALYHTIEIPTTIRTQESSLRRWSNLYTSIKASPYRASMIRKLVYSCLSEQTAEAVSRVLYIIRQAKGLQTLHWAAALAFLPNAGEVMATLNQASFPRYTVTVNRWHARSIIPTRPLRILTIKQAPWSGSINLAAVFDFASGATTERLNVETLHLVDVGEYYGELLDVTGLMQALKPPQALRLSECNMDYKAYASMMVWAGASMSKLVLERCRFEAPIEMWDPFPEEPIEPFLDSLVHLRHLETDSLAYPVIPVSGIHALCVATVNSDNLAALPAWLQSLTSLAVLDFRGAIRDKQKCPNRDSVEAVDLLARERSISVLPPNFLQELATWAAIQTELNEKEALAIVAEQEVRRQEIKGSGLLDDDFPLDLFGYPEEQV